MREQLDVLERACNAEPRHRTRRQAGNVATAEADVALALVDAADAVEGTGLAGAVGADEREQLARFHRKRQALQHGEAAEAQAQGLDLQLSHTTSGCGGTA